MEITVYQHGSYQTSIPIPEWILASSSDIPSYAKLVSGLVTNAPAAMANTAQSVDDPSATIPMLEGITISVPIPREIANKFDNLPSTNLSAAAAGVAATGVAAISTNKRPSSRRIFTLVLAGLLGSLSMRPSKVSAQDLCGGCWEAICVLEEVFHRPCSIDNHYVWYTGRLYGEPIIDPRTGRYCTNMCRLDINYDEIYCEQPPPQFRRLY